MTTSFYGDEQVSKCHRSLLSSLTLPQPLAIAPRRIHPDTRPAFIHLQIPYQTEKRGKFFVSD